MARSMSAGLAGLSGSLTTSNVVPLRARGSASLVVSISGATVEKRDLGVDDGDAHRRFGEERAPDYSLGEALRIHRAPRVNEGLSPRAGPSASGQQESMVDLLRGAWRFRELQSLRASSANSAAR
jgi:hypothetical protein